METNNNKNFYIALSVVFLILLIVGGMYLAGMFRKQDVVSQNNSDNNFTDYPKELPSPKVEVKSYGLGGKVVSISGNTVYVSSQRVVVGPNGNFITNDDKVVTVSKETKIFLSSFVKGKFTRTPAVVSDIKVGDSINMLSTEDISKMDSFTPTEVELQKVR